MLTIKFSMFDSLTNTRVKPTIMTLDSFAAWLTTTKGKHTDKKSLPLWSPTVFSSEYRSKSGAQEITCLVYDIDDGISPFDTWRLFASYYVIAHTSFSHKPNHHKYRIVLPLAKPIPVADWSRAYQAAQNLWDSVVGKGTPDQSALHDAARVYFRFALPVNAEGIADAHPMATHHWHKVSVHQDTLLDLDYSNIQEIEKPKEHTYVRKYSNGKGSLQDAYEDKNVRLAIATSKGASIQGNEARFIVCPKCTRKSVHFSIDPTIAGGTKWPTCNHANSCNWWGTFAEII